MKKTFIKLRSIAWVLIASITTIACSQENNLTSEEVKEIAKEAYIYGFPIVDNARIQYTYFVDHKSSDYKAPWNVIKNIPRVYTPEDQTIQTPNSDTPYSWIGLDLHQDAIVITIPPIETERYWSLQLIDMYTHNFAYLGSRVTGNNGGNFLIAGPNWKGKTPEGITKVIHSETQLALGAIRTQLFNPEDIKEVEKIQNKYVVQSLSSFLGKPEKDKVTIDFIKPLSTDEQKSSLEFFNQLNFQLQFTPTHPTEITLMKRFAKIGIEAGKPFEVDQLSPEMKEAFAEGIKEAWNDFNALLEKSKKGEITSGEVFGTREFLNNNYLYRMGGAILGIYGNSAEEAIYPSYYVDEKGSLLDGANNYSMYFAPGQLPPVNSFWSITMYELPSSLLVENPIDRYLINSTMVSEFNKDSNGGITIWIQNDNPGPNKEANWLPAPKGSFSVVMRLYWPKNDALTGEWVNPPMEKNN